MKKATKTKHSRTTSARGKAKAAPKKLATKTHEVETVTPRKVKPVKEEIPREPKTLKLSKDDAARYKALLLDLRDHLIDGVNFLASDNLKRSHREASGELSGYSLHMADAGTDNFDREFALSLVSSEQEAIYEIEEALKRLEFGTYGLCGMCEKPIRKERLQAVPFARLCVTCQSNMEKNRRPSAQTMGVFSEHADEEGSSEEESEE